MKQINLRDMTTVDNDFINIFKENWLKQVPSYLTDYLESNYDDNELLDSLKNDGSAEYGVYSYLTDTGVGISLPVSYCYGEHYEIIIDYKDIDIILNNEINN